MIYLLFYILGFGACLVLWALREWERAGAFKAATAEIERLRERDRLARQVIGNVYAGCVTLREKFNLGGKALLPASAEPTGQRFSHSLARVTAGLPANGGSDFSRREQ